MEYGSCGVRRKQGQSLSDFGTSGKYHKGGKHRYVWFSPVGVSFYSGERAARLDYPLFHGADFWQFVFLDLEAAKGEIKN